MTGLFFSYHRTLLHVCVAPRGEPATMGTWIGLCCLFMTRSNFSSNDLQVASNASSFASMLSNRRHIVWFMEYRNDWEGEQKLFLETYFQEHAYTNVQINWVANNSRASNQFSHKIWPSIKSVKSFNISPVLKFFISNPTSKTNNFVSNYPLIPIFLLLYSLRWQASHSLMHKNKTTINMLQHVHGWR